MEVRTLKEVSTLVVRTSTPVEKLPEVMGAAFAEVAQVAGSLGVELTGPPFAGYHNMDMANLDVEMGFPVSRKAAGKGRVKPGTLPGGRAAVTLHVGSYDRLHEAYDRLKGFVQQRGLELREFCYEVYLDDPTETPPEELKTEIYFPVEG